jgi:hypothetical protein
MSTGPAAGQFNLPFSLCMTKNNTIILVAECGNKRIQEVTPEGVHVKFVGLGVINENVWVVAMLGSIRAMVASTCHGVHFAFCVCIFIYKLKYSFGLKHPAHVSNARAIQDQF